MTTRLRAGIFVLAVVSFPMCSRELTRDEAQSVIERHSLIRPTDKVTVDAISSTSPTEAVVRATIAGATTNLKFRRFDTGWAWEFVETKAAGWVAPDVALGQIREEQRVVAAKAWAEQNRAPYAATAKTVWLVSVYHVHNPTVLAGGIELVRKVTESMANYAKGRPEMKDRLPVILNDRWKDAWGSDIELALDSKDVSWLITSPGADKVKGTEDDLLCLTTFRRGYEDGRQVWEEDRTWRVPENLDSILDGDVYDKDDKVEHSKVVKP